MELRIHGIGSHAPPDVDGEPTLVNGDGEIGVYVVDDDTQAFVWSRTTRGRLGVYRYFLLPFTLVNVAGYMHRPRGESVASFSLLVHLIGASVTLSYVFWLLAFAADAPRVYGASEGWQMAAFFVILAAVFGTLLLFAIVPRRRSAPLAEATPEVGQERFWARYPSRGSYLGHAALVALIYEVVNVLTTWRQDVIVSLAAGQVIALAILGTIVYLDAAGDDWTSEIGGVFALGVAVALPHIAFGGVFYASVSIVELFREIPGGQVRLAVLRPVPYWQFLPTFFTLAGLLWAFLLYRRVTDPGPGQSQRESEVRHDYGPSLPEDWVRRVAFKRLQPLIARMPGSLLAQPGKLLAVWLFVGSVGWLGEFTPDTNPATAFSRAFASELWGYVTLVVSGAAVVVVIILLQSERLHRHAATMFDVLGYWPRRHHVLSPPPYAARVTRELAAIVEEHDRLIVIGHSQGSVLGYTALWRAPAASRPRVILITCGSPLASLYAASFPAYFSAEEFTALRAQLRAWANLYRDTDPIGTPIFGASDSRDVEILEPEPGGTLVGHGGYWEDPAMLQTLRSMDDARDEP